jgi:hypothetical protein
MAGQLQVANADITVALTEIADLGRDLLRNHKEAVQRGDTQLAQTEKDALASIKAALIHMEAIKRQMARNLRCLGENQSVSITADAREKLDVCYDNLKIQNNDLKQQVITLQRSIDLADPHWATQHADAAREIDSLYYERLGIYGRVMQFIKHSSQDVSADEKECNELALSLDKEADQLRTTETMIEE